jgi:two-component SAPR family response regulator
MIVDDDYGTALFFKLSLEEEGFIAEIYTDPLTALSKFEPHIYRLLIVDIRMPNINGFEFFQKIKDIDYFQRICLTTAFETYYESLLESFPRLDVKCFIPKPITKEELVKRIAKQVD